MFLTEAANRGSVSTGYDIDNSVVTGFGSRYLYRTPSSAGNQKTWTLSFWIKRWELGGSNGQRIFEAWDGSTGTSMLFQTNNTFVLDLNAGSNYFVSNTAFRDTAAWYHFVIRVDTTQSTNTDRARIYLNGNELVNDVDGSWTAFIGQNTDLTWNKNARHDIGRFHNNDSFCQAYYSEIHNVDGASLAPTAFGEFDDNGIWRPKAANPTYGTNGFYLDFADASDLGDDESGNGNDFTENNIAAADQATDTPTNNFCTLNPLMVYGNALTTGPTEGATKVTGGSWAGTRGTMGVENGKWYYEFKTSGGDSIVGIQTDEGVALTGNGHNILSTCGFYVGTGGEVWIKDSTSGRNDRDVTHTFNASTINGIAINMDDNQISFYQNGSLVTNGGNIDLDGLSNKTVFPFASNYNTTQEFNFGGYTPISISSAATDENGYGTFEYAPPSGYYALCTKNLAEYG
jgi:hypothetical protein